MSLHKFRKLISSISHEWIPQDKNVDVYELIFNIHPDTIFVLDEDRRFIQVNSSFLTLSGYGKHELMDSTLDTLISSSESSSSYLNYMESAKESKPQAYRVGIRCKMGNLVELDVTCIAIAKEEAITYLCFAQQVKEDHEKVLFKTAQRIANFGVWELDIPSQKVTWSEETHRICGKDPDQHPEKLEEVWSLFPPLEKELTQKRLNDTLYQGTPYDFHHQIIRPDGEIRFVHEKAELIYDKFGNPARLVGIIHDITEQKRVKQQLEENEQRYRSLFSYNLQATFILDVEGNIQDINLAAEVMSGYSKKELIDKTFLHLIVEEDIDKVLTAFHHCLQGEPQTLQYSFRTKQGEKRIGVVFGSPIIVNHKITGVIGSIKDITEQIAMQAELENRKQQLQTLIDSIPDFIIFKDDENRWILANDFAIRFYELENVEYQGKTDAELAKHSPYYWQSLIACQSSDEKAWKAGQVLRTEEMILKKVGQTMIFDVMKVPVFHPDGSRKGLLVVGRDITERKAMENLNKHLAYHDSLTALPNRRSFEKKLRNQMKLADLSHDLVAIMYLDVDRFKFINDTLGHTVGDQLLTKFAERVQACISPETFLARMGGDEFTIIQTGLMNIREALKTASTILSRIQEPFLVDGYELYLTTSIGICFYPLDGDDVPTLMKHADLALYRAKEQGKNKYQIYTPSLDVQSFKTFTLEKDLRKALANEEFELHYQPRVDSHTGRIVAAEALIRWNHPDWGMVSPHEFIPLAIETGLIIPMGEWVVRTTCQQIKIWQQEGLPPLPISVNISAERFRQKNFVESIQRILEEVQIVPKWLEIEITESSLMENEETAVQSIKQLQEIGVNLSLDDFGTGYSSISYLRDFNFNCIKIDKSYLKELDFESSNAKILKGMIQLIKSLELPIVVEGVETLEQLHFVKGNNCDQVQGYLFSKPVPAVEFKKLLRKGILQPHSSRGLADTFLENKRRYFRLDFYFPLSAQMTIIKIKGKDIQLGTSEVLIEDMGLGGLRFLADLKLVVNREIILEFETEILEKTIKLCGAVVWLKEVEDGIYQYGLEFMIHETERDSLAKLLNNLSLLLKKSPVVPNCRFIKIDRMAYIKSLNK